MLKKLALLNEHIQHREKGKQVQLTSVLFTPFVRIKKVRIQTFLRLAEVEMLM